MAVRDDGIRLPEDDYPAIGAAARDVDRAWGSYWDTGGVPEGLAAARARVGHAQALVAAFDAAGD